MFWTVSSRSVQWFPFLLFRGGKTSAKQNRPLEYVMSYLQFFCGRKVSFISYMILPGSPAGKAGKAILVFKYHNLLLNYVFDTFFIQVNKIQSYNTRSTARQSH